jgi:hypothetical protein
MKYLVIAVAVWIAVLVFQNPKEAISAGILFIIACNVLLPSSSRFDVSQDAWELYYWATGLLIVTFAAALRLGPRTLMRVPASVKVFFLVASAAALVGFSNGNSPSYVIRQFYGSLLLVLYFAMAYRAGDERLFLRRLRTFGVLCAAGFFVYYAAIFSQYGFHKEITTLATLEGVVAILCVVTGLVERRLSWIASGLFLFCVPLLLFWRHVILAFVFAVSLAVAVKASSKSLKFICYSAAIFVLLPSMFPSGAAIVLEKLMNTPTIENFLPEGTRDVTSLEDRAIELGLSLDTLRAHPVFGSGLGSEFTWEGVTQGATARAYVENGWAYVAVKMGGMGLLAFSLFLFTTMRCLSKNSLAISVAFLTFVGVILFSEPALFQFTTSPLAGALAGLLYARRSDKEPGGGATAEISCGSGTL